VLRSSERASWLTYIRARIWAWECESIGSTVRWEGEMPDFRRLFGKAVEGRWVTSRESGDALH
jgi:hypothetical protein